MVNNNHIRCTEISNCYICGKEGEIRYANISDKLFGAPGEWNIFYCNDCDLLWINPMPVEEDIGKLYNNYFTHSSNDIANTSSKSSIKEYIKELYIEKKLSYNTKNNRIIKILITLLVDLFIPLSGESLLASMSFVNNTWGSNLLDCGCGDGKFLKRLQDRGWNVYGYEPDKTAVKEARRKGLNNVVVGTIEEANFEDNYFDVVTLNHVIEHLIDPKGTLAQIIMKIKTGGRIIIRVPNINSMLHRYFKQNWRGLECPRHLFLFSERSLSKMLTSNNFLQIDKVGYLSVLGEYIFATSKSQKEGKCDILLDDKMEKLKYWDKVKVFFIRLIEYFGNKLGFKYGEEIMIIAIKK